MSGRKPLLSSAASTWTWWRARARIPMPGQTVIGTGFATTPGGKGANQAVAVARLGYPVQMVGAVGEDVFGQALLDNLADAGVGTSAVARSPALPALPPSWWPTTARTASLLFPAPTVRSIVRPSTAMLR